MTQRRRGRVGPFSAGQIVVVELAVIAVGTAAAATRGRDVVLLGAVLFVAILALVATFARAGGTWWYERRLMSGGLRRRRRAARNALSAAGPPADSQPWLAPVASLAPGFAVRAILDRGSRIGVGQDSAGWYVVLEVQPPDPAPGAPSAVALLDRLAQLFAGSAAPVSALQLVGHALPGTTPVWWVAVRLDPADASAGAASRGGGMAGVDRALAAAAGRTGKALTAAGAASRILDDDELRRALLLSCVPKAPASLDARAAYEHWSRWRVGDIGHVCLRLTRWRGRSPAAALALAQATPAVGVTVSVTVRPEGTGLTVRSLLRVIAPTDALRAGVKAVTGPARRAGFRPRRIDGEHGPAVYASAPTGGGPR